VHSASRNHRSSTIRFDPPLSDTTNIPDSESGTVYGLYGGDSAHGGQLLGQLGERSDCRGVGGLGDQQ
jgi:hypothetical protein